MENIGIIRDYVLVIMASLTIAIDPKIAASSFMGIIIGYFLNDIIKIYRGK